MTDVLVTSVRPGGSSHGGETVPLEEINFSYGKIELKYTKLDMKGQPAGNVAAGWDLKANKKV